MKSMLLVRGLIPFCCVVILVLFTQCDDNNSDDNGSVQMEITDAPIDDANVQGAFVTITDIKVDGESVSGFSGRQTIDLLAYQNGEVKGLGTSSLETGAYSNVTLVLDYDADANGNSPGTYVLTNDGVKHALRASSSASAEITSNADFDVTDNDRTDLVIDFDVRKAIAYSGTSGSQYLFNSSTDLNSAVRIVNKDDTGTVSGEVTDALNTSEKFVVYAYAKGTFVAATERQGPVQFKKAVTSAVVDAQGNYKLAFLEDGEYELYFIGYEDANNDGKFEMEGSLLLNVVNSLDLKNISVNADANVTVDVIVTGILPL